MDRDNRSRFSWLTVGLKLAACGATIAAMAVAVVTLTPEGVVQSSDADVFDIGFKPRTQIFTDTLEAMGLDKPETFNLNGNVVYFSSAHAKGTPRRLMEEYQRKLVEHGFNRKAYGTPQPDQESQRELTEGLLLGDMIPLVVEEDHVIMAAGTLNGEPRSHEELMNLSAPPTTREGWNELLTGHKWVEFIRNNDYDNRSLVVSTWADDFDLEKHAPGSRSADSNFNPDMVPCPGCSRDVSFEKLDPGKRYNYTSYSTGLGVQQSVRYYIDAMKRRGWEFNETSRMYQAVREQVEFEGDDAYMLQFTRRDEFMNVLAYPSEDGSTIQLVHTD